jgi:hypothetical protein
VKEIFRKIQQDTDRSRETRPEKGEKSFFFLDIPKTLREIRSSDPEKKGGRKPVVKVLASLAVQSVEKCRVYQWRLVVVVWESCRAFAKHLARWKSRISGTCACWFVIVPCVYSQDPAEASEGVWGILCFEMSVVLYCRALETMPVPYAMFLTA